MSINYKDVIFGELTKNLSQMSELQRRFLNGFKPNTNQKRIREIIETSEAPDDSFLHLLIFGGTGTGKTWGILGYFWEILCTYPQASALVLRKTESQSLAGPYKDSIEMLDSFGITYSKRQKGSSVSITLPNGSYMDFKSETALKPRGEKAGKVAQAIGGFAYSLVAIEEVSDMPTSEVADAMPGRMREYAGDFRRVIAYLCNPPDRYHWVYTRFFGSEHNPYDPYAINSRYRAIQCNLDGNEYARESYKRDLEEDYARSGVTDSLLDGNFAPSGKGVSVYGGVFSKSFHTTDSELWKSFNPRLPITRGWDVGWHGNCCIIGQDDIHRNQIRIMKCHFDKFVDFETWIENTLNSCEKLFPGAHYQDYADVAINQHDKHSGKTTYEIMRGWGIRPLMKYSLVDVGVQIILRLLKQSQAGRPTLLIDRVNASAVVDMLGTGYCKDPQKNTYIKDGVYDHIADTLRYMLIFLRGGLASANHVNVGKKPTRQLPDLIDRRSRL